MTREIVFRPEAESELIEAYEWYEGRQLGLGNDFLLCVEAALSSLQRNPALYPVVSKQVRRALIHRFPFGIYYLIDPERVVIISVFHARRDPNQWKSRVQ
ncbi:MAG: type II toxin-antitoxin system RelE/ParE family toxin [Deltaproteobacteria bacterium]|nr:type II toxin-antitoxin system RelE/ParE family toxin [Deltaproteobacteria bacterium]